jgi:uncharacterized membrane protein YidH (DUF202 family)
MITTPADPRGGAGRRPEVAVSLLGAILIGAGVGLLVLAAAAWAAAFLAWEAWRLLCRYWLSG